MNDPRSMALARRAKETGRPHIGRFARSWVVITPQGRFVFVSCQAHAFAEAASAKS